MSQTIIQIIKIYQVINQALTKYGPSPLLVSLGCNFYPSCSEYAVESLKKYGFKKGLVCSVSRIFRCHPWANPGVDLP